MHDLFNLLNFYATKFARITNAHFQKEPRIKNWRHLWWVFDWRWVVPHQVHYIITLNPSSSWLNEKSIILRITYASYHELQVHQITKKKSIIFKQKTHNKSFYLQKNPPPASSWLYLYWCNSYPFSKVSFVGTKHNVIPDKNVYQTNFFDRCVVRGR